MVKLLSVDLDGTLLNSDVEIDESSMEAMDKAIEQGVIIIPTTGRSFDLVPDELINHEGINYFITSSGANVYSKEDEDTIIEIPMANEDLVKIYEIAKEYNPSFEIYIDGKVHVSQNDYDRLEDYIPKEEAELFRPNMTVISDEEFERCEMFA